MNFFRVYSDLVTTMCAADRASGKFTYRSQGKCLCIPPTPVYVSPILQEICLNMPNTVSSFDVVEYFFIIIHVFNLIFACSKEGELPPFFPAPGPEDQVLRLKLRPIWMAYHAVHVEYMNKLLEKMGENPDYVSVVNGLEWIVCRGLALLTPNGTIEQADEYFEKYHQINATAPVARNEREAKVLELIVQACKDY